MEGCRTTPIPELAAKVQVHPFTIQFGPPMLPAVSFRVMGRVAGADTTYSRETSGFKRHPPLQNEPSAERKDERGDRHGPQDRGEDIRRVVNPVDDQC